MNALLTLSAATDPPSLPSWLWLGVLSFVVLIGPPVAKSIASVAQWVAKKDAPSVTSAVHQTQLDALAKWATDHEKTDADRHAEIRRWFEETRESGTRIESSIRTLDSRLVKNETIVERELPPREPTGQHKALR